MSADCPPTVTSVRGGGILATRAKTLSIKTQGNWDRPQRFHGVGLDTWMVGRVWGRWGLPNIRNSVTVIYFIFFLIVAQNGQRNSVALAG